MKAETNRGRVQNNNASVIRLSLGATAILIFVAAIYAFGVVRNTARRADCQAAMKQFGLDFKRYASESKEEKWPALASTGELWVPDLEALYGKYRNFTNPANMVSIFHPDKPGLTREIEDAWNLPLPDYAKAARIFGESFGYLGYMVQSDVDFETLRLARSQNAIHPDGTLPPAMNPGTVFPLREGVERHLMRDINGPAPSHLNQWPIPVLLEIATWKYKDSVDDFKGTNVLYMDGHVEFVPLGTFPVLPSILDALNGI
jgi:prepilin-type processing-associated H-X9-DG protein